MTAPREARPLVELRRAAVAGAALALWLLALAVWAA